MWKEKFIDLALVISNWSKDRSTKVGAIIVDDSNRVVSMGYNGFPTGFNDDVDERHERPQKYDYTEHAERNAIYNACKHGVSVDNCTMYLQWFPCSDCARAIIQTGIKKIICKKPNFNENHSGKDWGLTFKHSHEMLNECNVIIEYYN